MTPSPSPMSTPFSTQATLTPPADALGHLYSTYYPRSRVDASTLRVPAPDPGWRGWLDGAGAAAFRWVPPGVRVLDEPFHARGPVASAGGCLASQYLSAWLMWRKAGESAARDALSYAAPVGEKAEYVERLLARVRPFMEERGG